MTRREAVNLTDDEEEEIDIGVQRVRTFHSALDRPVGRTERCCIFLDDLFDKCSNCWCRCFAQDTRRGWCKCCSVFWLIIGFFLAIILIGAANNAEKTEELLYFTKPAWDQYNLLQKAIQSDVGVCDTSILPRLYVECDYTTAVYGKSGAAHLLKIIETGTRVSTMKRICPESLFSFKGFLWRCFSPDWHQLSSAALYDYNISLPHTEKVFQAKKHIFLVRNPFESVIDLWYQDYYAKRPLNYRSNAFSEKEKFLQFAMKELLAWDAYMDAMRVFFGENGNSSLLVWYDSLNTQAMDVIAFLRDPGYYPTLDQAAKCIEAEDFESVMSPLDLPPKEELFKGKDKEDACKIIEKNWDQTRWGNFCTQSA